MNTLNVTIGYLAQITRAGRATLSPDYRIGTPEEVDTPSCWVCGTPSKNYNQRTRSRALEERLPTQALRGLGGSPRTAGGMLWSGHGDVVEIVGHWPAIDR
ncbi:MAG: hypothetical protein ACYCZM_02895 [Acidimicrobiales bacterium]